MGERKGLTPDARPLTTALLLDLHPTAFSMSLSFQIHRWHGQMQGPSPHPRAHRQSRGGPHFQLQPAKLRPSPSPSLSRHTLLFLPPTSLPHSSPAPSLDIACSNTYIEVRQFPVRDGWARRGLCIGRGDRK